MLSHLVSASLYKRVPSSRLLAHQFSLLKYRTICSLSTTLLTTFTRNKIDRMGRAKRYNRDQLLDILENQCPEAFAKFPKADSFVFTNTDDGDAETRTFLSVGTVIVVNNQANPS
ncbi:hypothetical protein TUN205_07261 [Pyrenophora tritici-repentis]|nr:hypothetical protein TUN205_07261 [Pyrenophora tritici-repentis]